MRERVDPAFTYARTGCVAKALGWSWWRLKCGLRTTKRHRFNRFGKRFNAL